MTFFLQFFLGFLYTLPFLQWFSDCVPHFLNNSHQFLFQKHISLEKVLVLSVKARKSKINQDRLALDVKIPTIILTGIPGMLQRSGSVFLLMLLWALQLQSRFIATYVKDQGLD